MELDPKFMGTKEVFMPAPLAPLAGIALRYGAVAVATYAATRAIPKLRRDQETEDTLDKVEEGLETRRDGEQVNATGRFRRVVRLGSHGPAVEIDAAALTRIRIRRIR
ncbi:MAG: hypothetical protein AAF647_05520 [Pseudomonadota bacterium]